MSTPALLSLASLLAAVLAARGVSCAVRDFLAYGCGAALRAATVLLLLAMTFAAVAGLLFPSA